MWHEMRGFFYFMPMLGLLIEGFAFSGGVKQGGKSVWARSLGFPGPAVRTEPERRGDFVLSSDFVLETELESVTASPEDQREEELQVSTGKGAASPGSLCYEANLAWVRSRKPTCVRASLCEPGWPGWLGCSVNRGENEARGPQEGYKAVKDFSSFISVRRPTLDDSQAKLNAWSDDGDSFSDLSQWAMDNSPSSSNWRSCFSHQWSLLLVSYADEFASQAIFASFEQMIFQIERRFNLG